MRTLCKGEGEPPPLAPPIKGGESLEHLWYSVIPLYTFLFSLLVVFLLTFSVAFAEEEKEPFYSRFMGNTKLVPPFLEAEEEEETGFNISNSFEKGMRELGISGGGSFSMETPRYTTFTLLPKIGWMLATFDKPKGALEFELEPFISLVSRPERTFEVGGAIMMGYNFETGTKLVPFVHAGGGAIYSGLTTGGLSEARELRQRGQPDEAKKLLKSHLNAIAQMGFGVKYFFKEKTALNLEYRWRHISDPSTHDDLGIDSNFILFGVSYFY